jgi:hypothetical protein
MKLRELLSRVKSPEHTSQNKADFESFREDLLPNCYEYPVNWNDFNVYEKGFGEWMCTDSAVGSVAYFYEDTLVAFSYQSGRKSARAFAWVSLELAQKVKEHILAIIDEDDELNVSVIETTDFEEDMGVGFVVHYASQLLTKNVIYKHTGESVHVIKDFYSEMYKEDKYKDKSITHDMTFHGVVIKFSDGREELVYLNKDILVPWDI